MKRAIAGRIFPSPSAQLFSPGGLSWVGIPAPNPRSFYPLISVSVHSNVRFWACYLECLHPKSWFLLPHVPARPRTNMTPIRRVDSSLTGLIDSPEWISYSFISLSGVNLDCQHESENYIWLFILNIKKRFKRKVFLGKRIGSFKRVQNRRIESS